MMVDGVELAPKEHVRRDRQDEVPSRGEEFEDLLQSGPVVLDVLEDVEH